MAVVGDRLDAGSDSSMAIVAVARGAAGAAADGQTAYAIDSGVVVPGDDAAIGIDLLSDAVKGIVTVTGGLPVRIGAAGEVTGTVVGIGRGARVGTGLGQQIAECIVAVGGAVTVGIGGRGEVVLAIVGVTGSTVQGIGLLNKAVEGIVGPLVEVPQRIGGGDLVTVVIVAVMCGLVGSTNAFEQATQIVMSTRRVAHWGIGGVIDKDTVAVALDVKKVADVVAARIGDLDEVIGCIIAIAQRGSIWRAHLSKDTGSGLAL